MTSISSFNTIFMPRLRPRPRHWQQVQAQDPAFATFLKSGPRLNYAPAAWPDEYAAFIISSGVQ
jgi:hypothetical protein